MSRMSFSVSVGALLVIAVQAAPVLAQTPAHVRVVNSPARIQRWQHGPATEVLRVVDPGTTLDVLDEDSGWFWVVVPPDIHGTRKAGWIRATNVERVMAAVSTTQGQLADALPAVSMANESPSTEEDKVTITEKHNDTPAALEDAPTAPKAYAFEDVHFDRDQYSLRPEVMDTLRAAAAALKADPSLVVNIAGYTCSLGTTAHNHALGIRRANAVKEYFVSEGIASDRLHTRSIGERDAKHDNSREETRRLNRRVALVPDAPH